MESEKTLERKLNSEIKKLGGWSVKLLPHLTTGLPDRLCLLPKGVLFFAEIKTTNKRPTAVQELIHKKLKRLGFEVRVIDTSQKITEVINQHNSNI